MHSNFTIRKYEDDYIEILKELNPEKYRRYVKEHEENEKMLKELEKESEEREKKELEEGKKLGGKV